MTSADELKALLIKRQNPDGGWPFRRGVSWTEPTALALMALEAHGYAGDSRPRAASWLVQRQMKDGGWPPGDTVPTSTWVTSLALLALACDPDMSSRCQQANAWVLDHIYPELSAFQRILTTAFHVAPSRAPGSSPWFPGTAGWVIPTALGILAASFWSKTNKQTAPSRLTLAQAYLLSRRCPDGGWNHGGSSYRSENACSYPETTGLALLAIADTRGERSSALRLAGKFAAKPESLEGLSWLRMALLAHGHSLPDSFSVNLRPRATGDIALYLIALAAERGRNRLLPAV